MDSAPSASGQRGEQCVRKAEDKLKDPKGFSFETFVAMFAAPNYRKEEALEHLLDAAKHFKTAKECMHSPQFFQLTNSGKKAGETYLKIADILTDLHENEPKIAGNL